MVNQKPIFHVCCPHPSPLSLREQCLSHREREHIGALPCFSSLHRALTWAVSNLFHYKTPCVPPVTPPPPSPTGGGGCSVVCGFLLPHPFGRWPQRVVVWWGKPHPTWRRPDLPGGAMFNPTPLSPTGGGGSPVRVWVYGKSSIGFCARGIRSSCLTPM